MSQLTLNSALGGTFTVAPPNVIGTVVATLPSTSGTLASVNADTTGSALSVKSNATTGLLQIAGPAAGSTRVMTTPDANFTVGQALVGEVKAFTTGTVPTGYLECNGALVSTTTYAELYAIIGYTYGGTGASFTLPDFRGKFLRGWAHGSANDPDRAARTNRGDGTIGDFVGTNQVDGFKSHTHTTYGSPSQGFTISGGAGWGVDVNASPATSATGGSETRPININVMYIIKY